MGAIKRRRRTTDGRSASLLTNEELIIAIVGAKGAGTLHESLANYHNDLVTLRLLKAPELQSVLGLTARGAQVLEASLELSNRLRSTDTKPNPILTSIDIYNRCRADLEGLLHEEFHVLCLTSKHRVIRNVLVAKGGFTTCSILPREVFAPALAVAAVAVALVHNHPSGDPEPSEDDLILTAHLKKAGKTLGIRIIDHIVIGNGRYYSMMDEGRFESL